ncbi:MAG TPA: C4-type zinc ribbon domain-containing protein [bacterium]|nr:C4-type zinc ribbon domain-containing protein [bacterium]
MTAAESTPGVNPVEASEGLAALAALWAVQRADLQLAALRAERAALDDGTALREETEAARTAAKDAAARLHEAQATLRDQELQLATADTKKKKAEGDLYGGRVSNPKELAGLEEELAGLARTRDHLEDRILGLFDEVETLKHEAVERQAASRLLEERLAAHVAAYERERGRIDAEIAAREADRAGLAAAVEPRLLKKYEGIAAQEGGVGMVAIVGGFCGGCRNDVPARFVSRVRGGDVVTCERCHRILYLDGQR